MPSSDRRPCLLLVDDTPANIDVLVGILGSDYNLKIANRGAKALQICASGQPVDLVLLDVMMPEMDGYEVCRRLRSDPATRDLPIIFLTAKTETEDVVLGFELGANDYVPKPFRPPELLARVRTQLALREQRREIARKNGELTEMVHILCHDIANHFAVAKLALEIAELQPRPDVPQLLARLTTAVRNGIALTTVVRELRRAEDKSVRLIPVSLRAAVVESIELVEDRLRAKEIVPRVSVPDIDVMAEPGALVGSVLVNLLVNAAKFSRPGSALEVQGEIDGDRVRLRLRDHGIGIPADMLQDLFEVTKSTSRPGTAGEKGTGFGMPLVKKFVDLFGGSIRVQSRDEALHPDDSGTEFTIEFRRAP
jgi:CheY-like chemotaxis protein